MADATLTAENVHANTWSIFPCAGDRACAMLVLFPPRPLYSSGPCTACVKANVTGGIAIPASTRHTTTTTTNLGLVAKDFREGDDERFRVRVRVRVRGPVLRD